MIRFLDRFNGKSQTWACLNITNDDTQKNQSDKSIYFIKNPSFSILENFSTVIINRRFTIILNRRFNKQSSLTQQNLFLSLVLCNLLSVPPKSNRYHRRSFVRPGVHHTRCSTRLDSGTAALCYPDQRPSTSAR